MATRWITNAIYQFAPTRPIHTSLLYACSTLRRRASFVFEAGTFINGLRILVVAGLGLLAAIPAPAQQQASPQPVLRLETGMHTAPIRAAASDAAGELLATGSG